jgi:hypothetical protein
MPQKIIKTQPQAIVTLTNIKWDTDGKRIKLPKTCKVQVSYDYDETLDIIHETAMDGASGSIGWCISSCSMNKIELIDKP